MVLISVLPWTKSLSEMWAAVSGDWKRKFCGREEILASAWRGVGEKEWNMWAAYKLALRQICEYKPKWGIWCRGCENPTNIWNKKLPKKCDWKFEENVIKSANCKSVRLICRHHGVLSQVRILPIYSQFIFRISEFACWCWMSRCGILRGNFWGGANFMVEGKAGLGFAKMGRRRGGR